MLGFCKQHFFLNSSMSLGWCLFRFNEFPNFMESLWSIFVLHLLEVGTWFCISTAVNAETFCTKDILSQTLCSEDDFRQLPGRRLRPRLRVWSLALMAFLTSSLMCSLPSQVWEKVFLLLCLFSVNASPGFQCDVKWNSRRESAHFRTKLTLFSKLIQNDSFLSLLVETSTVLLKDNFV